MSRCNSRLMHTKIDFEANYDDSVHTAIDVDLVKDLICLIF